VPVVCPNVVESMPIVAPPVKSRVFERVDEQRLEIHAACVVTEAGSASCRLSDWIVMMIRYRGAGLTAPRVHNFAEPLPDLGKFDVVVSSFVIHHVEDARKRELYREVFEMREPGGVFCNLEHVASPTRRLHEEFYRSMGMTSADEDPSNRRVSVDEQLAWLSEIGFVETDPPGASWPRVMVVRVAGKRRKVMMIRFTSRCAAAATIVTALLSAQTARADAVLDWNVVMLATIAPAPPFPTARFAAVTELAVFEAVNAISGEYEPYLGTITAPPGASAEAAAAAAAHGVLVFYFPLKAAALDAALATSLAAIPDGQSKIDGIATGNAAAAAMIALRANDGSGTGPLTYLPTSSDPGQWQLTAGCSAAGGLFYNWRNVTPFGLVSGDQFRLGPPPQLTTGDYRKDYIEVKAVGAIDSVLRPADRADIVLFYAAFSPVSWANSAARQIATAQQRSLSQNARAFALLNMAISDGAVATFDAKYHYTIWRPETAIHGAADDGDAKTDPDVHFAPFIAAPCFPSYPSAHGTLSGAAREVLERLYGPSGHDITFSIPSLPLVVLHYTDFKHIVEDISDARVYGGIHFRYDQDGGEQMGRDIGAYIYKHRLQVVPPVQ
jgi:hypothetical protein